MNETKNKREWVKNVAIVFLIILLILTFFSNTILNYSLPEVAAQYIDSGTITTKIRGTGVIESGDPYNVKIKQMRKVDSVEVRSGDYVQAGDVLCVLSTEDSTELETAREELIIAQRTLDSAENEFLLKLITGGYDSSVIANAGEIKSADEYLYQVTAAKEAVDKAKKEYEEQKSKVEQWQTQIAALETQISITPSSNADTTEEQKACNEAKKRVEEAAYALTEATNRLDAIDREIERRQGLDENHPDYDLGSLPQQREEAVVALNSAKTEKDNADLVLSRAENALNEKIASGDTSGILNNLQNQLATARLELEKENKNLTKRQEIVQINSDNYDSLMNNISASFGLNTLQNSIDDAKAEVKKKKEKVEKLEEQMDGVSVAAPISGRIIDVYVQSGMDTPENGVVMTMQPEGKGFTMTMTVTNEQAKRLSVGDKAELVNSWRYDDMEIKIASIKQDKNNPGKSKVVTFDVSGNDVLSGQSISISVGQKSANYDMIVPNSAIREDNNGKFVLIVESKSSPIGTRYYATRVDVEVLASDDTRSAISGGLYGSEFVITTSNKPVEKNKQVRLAE